MKTGHAAAFLALLAIATAAQQPNPLSQVISLLDSLAAKVARDGEAEAKTFAEFSAWCTEASRTVGFDIQTFSAKKDKLEAAIGKLAADAETSAAKVEELAGSIASSTADLTSATQVREKEAADFQANEQELVEVIDTLGRAVQILEREAAKNPALVQTDAGNLDGLVKSLSALVDAAAFPSADKARLLALVQAQRSAAEDADDQPPAVAAYKSHSSSILDVLEDLKEKAEEQLSDLRKAETNARHNYEMLKQSLDDQVAADNKDLEEEKAAKAAAQEAKAAAEGDLGETTRSLADSQVALQTTQTTCTTAQADHEATVASRAEELKVIAEAKQALESSTGAAAGQAYSFLELGQASSSRSRLRTRADLAGAEVVNVVKRLAQTHHSAALAQLASRIAAVLRYGAAAGEDPFAKVRAMISELISRLEAEASSEATEKSYCDEQLAETEAKRGELEAALSKVTSKIDQAAAESATLKEEVAELQASLAALAAQQAEMDTIRRDSHAAYVQAKADLELGLQGVRKALGLLREYYGNAALLQQPAAPEGHGKAASAGSSIVGLLEVVESDFAKSLAREEVAESDAQADYDKVTQQNKVTRAVQGQDVAYKTREFQELDKTLSELASDRSTTDAELAAVLEYYAKIKERCVAKPETYEQRKARRQAEVEGLKEALRVLEDETALLQRKKRGARAAFLAPAGH